MNADPRQPLYVAPEERVTLEQLKDRARKISDQAVSQSKRIASDIAEENLTKAALVAVGVVLLAASLAYFLGNRAGAARAAQRALPY